LATGLYTSRVPVAQAAGSGGTTGSARAGPGANRGHHRRRSAALCASPTA